MSIFNYKRRSSSEVKVGCTVIGGDKPVKLQSMNNTSTNDTEASVAQALRIAEAGADLVRLTTQGVKEAANMGEIRSGLSKAGCDIPLVADVHFNPAAAFKAAETCEKVRINPGNFADPVHRFLQIDYSDEEYREEIENIHRKLAPFLEVCREHNTAIRLGVNHGSLSDRIMSRFGDTPEGMVESLMEYLRICRKEGFENVVLSIKASNVFLMVKTVRLLVSTMEKEDMHYPIHLGVTEAGNEDEGRIKSAVGIGTLLAEGIGDTIRVSLSEEPEREIPVARILRDYISAREGHEEIPEPRSRAEYPARSLSRRLVENARLPEPLIEGLDFELPEGSLYVEASTEPEVPADDKMPVTVTSNHVNPVGEIASWIERFLTKGGVNPIVIDLHYKEGSEEEIMVKAAADFGALLLNGYGNGIKLTAPTLSKEKRNSVLLDILQAVRLRFTKPDYIACPGCGRTLFNLQETLEKIKEATSGLVGVKIGVMGCIVNGPGEMADADYGYVGAGRGKVSLYRGKEVIKKNIDEKEAVSELLKLIASDTAK